MAPEIGQPWRIAGLAEHYLLLVLQTTRLMQHLVQLAATLVAETMLELEQAIQTWQHCQQVGDLPSYCVEEALEFV